MEESNPQNYTYTCPKCPLSPKILSLYRNTVQLECQVHGKMSIELDVFMEKSLKNSFYGRTCGICNKNKQKDDKNIFKFCYDCNKVICYQCIFTHQKSFPMHQKIILSKDYNTKCFIHPGANYEEFCYTCNKNICNQCFDEHKSHDRESLVGLDEDIIEGDINIINLRKEFLETVMENLAKEINDINKCIKFYDLILNTKKNFPNNAYHVQNINILSRDLDSQYEYLDKKKEIENLKNEINSLKKLDQVRDKFIKDFNAKYGMNITKNDEKIDLTGKKIKNEGLQKFSRIELPNLKVLILSNNDISSFKCLKDSNLKNLEILKLDNNRINSVEVVPSLSCVKLKELYLNENKICNIDAFNNILHFDFLEIIDLRNNNFDKSLEKNEKTIHELKQMIKTVKIESDGSDEKDPQEPEITDEELNEILNS